MDVEATAKANGRSAAINPAFFMISSRRQALIGI
jgi:hypothetical protein